MRKKYAASFFLYAFSFAVFFSFERCANVVTPEGGTKDTAPPSVTNASPPNGQVNFNAEKIEIHFSEFITLNDPFSQVVISPPLDEAPEIKSKNKSITIHFKSPLHDSTTYTINFGTSIRDITEGNILTNFTYVFSTGSYLDSISVSGNVKDLLTGAASDKALAELYLHPEDSDFLKKKPYYFTKVDKNGNYIINNIKQGKYRLYAIEDQNFNYYYDLPNEKIGFQNKELLIDSNIVKQNLSLFSENKIKQNLLEVRSPRYGLSRIVFAKNSDSASISYTGKEPEKGLFLYSKNRDTVYFWHTDMYLNEHSFQMHYDETDTTVTSGVKTYPQDSDFLAHKSAFTANVIKKTRSETVSWDLKKNVVLDFSNPVAELRPENFKLWSDSLSNLVIPLIYIDSTDRNKIIIHYAWKENTKYGFSLLQGAVKDIFGLANDTASFTFTTKKIIDYSTLKLSITKKEPTPLVVQICTKDFSVLQEYYLPVESFNSNTATLTIPYLLPAFYQLRAIDDIDGNEKWTSGDLLQNRLPEPVYVYPAGITLRANWENEITWEIK